MIPMMVGYHPLKHEKRSVHSVRATRAARRVNHRPQSGPICFGGNMTVNIKGCSIKIDEDDVHFLAEHRWYISESEVGRFYVRRNNSKHPVYLHRIIVGAGKGQQVDHIDGDTSNNSRSNLRICTNTQNSYNSKKRKINTSGFKGVSWRKSHRKWIAQIQSGGKNRCLGYFDDPILAHEAYKKEILKVAGEFARC
jgi:hypothetical protein